MMGTIRRLEVRAQAIIRQISGQLLCDKPFQQLRDDGHVGDWPVWLNIGRVKVYFWQMWSRCCTPWPQKVSQNFLGILPILLNCHCRYATRNIHACLLMWRWQTIPSCMCSICSTVYLPDCFTAGDIVWHIVIYVCTFWLSSFEATVSVFLCPAVSDCAFLCRLLWFFVDRLCIQ